jgi:hypothetical protein
LRSAVASPVEESPEERLEKKCQSLQASLNVEQQVGLDLDVKLLKVCSRGKIISKPLNCAYLRSSLRYSLNGRRTISKKSSQSGIRLHKEVMSLQDQMAGQRDAFQVATESIRQDAERERAIGQRVERLTIEARDVPVADAKHWIAYSIKFTCITRPHRHMAAL